MSNFLQKQMKEIVDSKMGTSKSRVIIGIVTKIEDNDNYNKDKKTCTVCPIDLDALWDMKMFYGKTKIDRNALQGSIQRVSYSSSKSVIAEKLLVGDKVSIAYDEDKPYIIEKIGTSYSNKTLSTEVASSSSYEWLTPSNGPFGEYSQEMPLPDDLME